MKTYKAFLEELELYADGATVQLSWSDYLDKDNEILYNQAQADGYIEIYYSELLSGPMMRVLKHPCNINKNSVLIISNTTEAIGYFNDVPSDWVVDEH